MEAVEAKFETEQIDRFVEQQLQGERKRLEEACREAQAAQDEIEELKSRLLDMEAIQARFAADNEAAALAWKQVADLEDQLTTERRTFATKVAGLEEQLITEQSARLDAESRINEAIRMREESAEKLERVATLMAQIEASRTALLDAEAMHSNTAKERDNALALLEQVQRDYLHAEETIGLAVQMRDEAVSEVAKVAGEFNDLCRERDDIANKLEQATLELKNSRPKRIADEREKALEDRASSAKLTRLEARVKILQAENDALRGETGALRRRQKEMTESLAMATEEARGTRSEMLEKEVIHLALNSRLRIQLEEARRARTMEMNALVKKLCRSEEQHSDMSYDQEGLRQMRYSRVSNANSIAHPRKSNSLEEYVSSPSKYGIVKEICIPVPDSRYS